MNKLFNKILIPTIAPLVILPIASCSGNQQKQTDTIEIISSIDDITLIQGSDFLSKPIEAKCFDSQGLEKWIDISFDIKIKGFDKKPDWISITDKKEISIKGINELGEYEVSLIAFNSQEKIYSQPKTFTIKVISERHIVPDSISIEIENDKYCMYGEETTIPIKIVPFKQDVEEKYLIKDTKCTIQVLHGPSTDKGNKNLFDIGGSVSNPTIIVSKDTDKNFINSYRIKLTASLIANPNICVSKELTINIDNIYLQYSPKCKCTFTRENSDDNWTLSTVDKETHIIYDVPSLIQNRPVTKIGANLCQKSQITELVQAILPTSIVAIGANAFVNQKALSSIEMPGVKYVGDSAFENDSLLELRYGIKSPTFYYVGNNAFYGCKLINFDAQDDLMWIGNYAFKNAGLRTFTIGENCYYIGTESFAECSQLNSFKIKTDDPPDIGGAIFNKTDGFSDILVPSESLSKYIADPYWSRLGKNIKGI